MYNQQSFEHMMFNPMNESLLDDYPHLEGLFPPIPQIERTEPKDEDDPGQIIEPEMNFEEKKVNILRYVIALYDPLSPLIAAHQALPSRQKYAAQVAGFAPDEDLHLLYEMSDRERFIPDLVVNYLKECGAPISYATMVANEAVYWEFFHRMVRYDKDDDDSIIKAKMGEELTELQSRLEAARTKFFGNDDKLKQAVSAVRTKRNTPEKWAKVKKNV